VLGKTVTAEGVETEQQRDAVADMGCELAQGYYFGPPVPAADIAARLGTGASGRRFARS
jgi:EAL domain-containing protein (putative c-di-GMP-specific phosphodiesterase class I)